MLSFHNSQETKDKYVTRAEYEAELRLAELEATYIIARTLEKHAETA